MTASICLLAFVIGTALSIENDNTTTYPDFSAWNAIVSSQDFVVSENQSLQHVHLNLIKYGAIANSTLFTTTLNVLSAVQSNTSSWSKFEYFAYFVNAYNAMAVKIIVDHACEADLFGDCAALPSIRLASSLFSGSIWSKQVGVVNGRNVSLDDLEDALRHPHVHGANFDFDPRLHSAIVRASISSPSLFTAAFEPATLDAVLNETMSAFLANDQKGLAFDNATNTVHMSYLFSVYESDFVPSPLAFALPFLNDTTRALIENGSGASQQVSFMVNNWDLNGIPLECAANRACFSDIDALITGLAAVCTIALGICCVCVKRKSRSAAIGYQQVS